MISIKDNYIKCIDYEYLRKDKIYFYCIRLQRSYSLLGDHLVAGVGVSNQRPVCQIKQSLVNRKCLIAIKDFVQWLIKISLKN